MVGLATRNSRPLLLLTTINIMKTPSVLGQNPDENSLTRDRLCRVFTKVRRQDPLYGLMIGFCDRQELGKHQKYLIRHRYATDGLTPATTEPVWVEYTFHDDKRDVRAESRRSRPTWTLHQY